MLIAVVAAVAFGLSACGGPSSPGVVSLGKTTAGSTGGPVPSNGLATAEVEFAHCMRTHRLPNFPDPVTNGTETDWTPGYTRNSQIESPTFRTAWAACKKYIPGNPGNLNGPTLSPQMVAKMLKFAECMRAHGVTDFPDPPAAGQSLLSRKPPIGFDTSPAILEHANRACKYLGISVAEPSAAHACSLVKGAGPTGVVLAVDRRQALDPAEC